MINFQVYFIKINIKIYVDVDYSSSRNTICDPTQVNEADVVRGQIVILLSFYSTGIMNHFDTKMILLPFSIPNI